MSTVYEHMDVDVSTNRNEPVEGFIMTWCNVNEPVEIDIRSAEQGRGTASEE